MILDNTLRPCKGIVSDKLSPCDVSYGGRGHLNLLAGSEAAEHRGEQQLESMRIASDTDLLVIFGLKGEDNSARNGYCAVAWITNACGYVQIETTNTKGEYKFSSPVVFMITGKVQAFLVRQFRHPEGAYWCPRCARDAFN